MAEGYASHRFSELAHVCTPSGLMQRIRPTSQEVPALLFRYDVVIPAVLPSLMAFAQEARILSGTQLPFRTRRCRCVVHRQAGRLRQPDGGEHSAISHRNAGVLFPRLVPKNAAPERPIA